MDKKNIFLTGAAGFIGFHLAKYLNKQGHLVIGLDNYNDYYSPSLKKDRAQQLSQEGIKVIQGDICDLPLMQKMIAEHSITHVAHLAAQAGVRYSLLNPQAYIKSNVEGFVNVLELCRQFSHLKLVYASSSSVYGQNTKIPFEENDRTDNPASLYGATKKANELLANTYHHLYKVPSYGLRFFTVYGPWGRPDMAYFSFTKAILEGKPIEIFNRGRMQRDFTYIDDIVAGISAAIEKVEGCELFNLGNHHPENLLSMVEIIEEALGKKADKIMTDMQKGDVETTFADIKKSQKKLNFTPRTSLKEGMAKFIEWYKSYY